MLSTLEPESAYSAFNLNLVSELAPLHRGGAGGLSSTRLRGEENNDGSGGQGDQLPLANELRTMLGGTSNGGSGGSEGLFAKLNAPLTNPETDPGKAASDAMSALNADV